MHKLTQILQMIRFSHTLFALPFALIAALLAWSVPAPTGAASGANRLVHFRWQSSGNLAVHGHGAQRGDGL